MLDYRADQLNHAQQKVAAEEHKRQALLERIREADAVIEQAFIDQQKALTETTLDPIRLQSFPQFIWQLKQSRFQEYQALQMQERKVRDAREELKQALIKKKSLDILKDKDQLRHRKRIEKAEEEFLGEMALNRIARQAKA